MHAQAAEEAAPAEEKKEELKAIVTIKLLSFEASKKIAVVKEARHMWKGRDPDCTPCYVVLPRCCSCAQNMPAPRTLSK